MRDHRARMGKTMPYTSEDGAEHLDSFWCLKHLDVDINNRRLALGFVGYHSAGAYDAGRDPVARADKSYFLQGEAFDRAVGKLVGRAGVPISVEIIQMAWEVALSTLDERLEYDSTTGEVTGGHSFFEEAVDAA